MAGFQCCRDDRIRTEPATSRVTYNRNGTRRRPFTEVMMAVNIRLTLVALVLMPLACQAQEDAEKEPS